MLRKTITLGYCLVAGSVVVIANPDHHDGGKIKPIPPKEPKGPVQEEPRWEKLIYKRESEHKKLPTNILERLNHDIARIHEKGQKAHHPPHNHPNWDRAQQMRRLALLEQQHHGKIMFPFVHVQKPRPRLFLEVVTIREKVVVDQQNKPKGIFAMVQNAVYASNVGGNLQKVFQSTMTMRPKIPVIKNINNHFVKTSGMSGHVEGDNWFEKAAEKLHLDEFWPRIGVSMMLGFLFTLLIFGMIKLVQLLFLGTNTGYKDISDEESNENDTLLNSERKMAAAVKTVDSV